MKRLSWRKRMKYERLLEDGEKIPRKIKKHILGYRLSKSKIRKKISKLEVKVNVWPNGYKVPYVENEFCPKCGCKECYSSGEMAEYPETWVQYYCSRCGEIVAEADNSAVIHSLVYIKESENK